MRKSISAFLMAMAMFAVVTIGTLHAQRSTATQVQFDPATGLFHFLANGVDYVNGGQTTYNCGTTVACANTVALKRIIVYGSAPFSSASPSTITLTGLPFTSTTSYVCTVANATSAAHTAVDVINASASSTVITGPNTITDTMNYVCAGT